MEATAPETTLAKPGDGGRKFGTGFIDIGQ
jgi:hypothetical protein